MTRVTIKVESYPTTDIYWRKHVLSMDKEQTGDPREWANTVWVTTCVPTSKEITVDLPVGSHFVVYAVSGYVPDYAWHAKIFVNDELIAERDVGRRTHLRAEFWVGPLPDEWLILAMLAGSTPLLAVGGVVAAQEVKKHVG